MSWIKCQWDNLLSQIRHEKAQPAFIARGWAIGMFYGCTIPFGFQLMLSIPTAMLLRGSKIGATLGTLITNHFTIFIIYPMQCWLGNQVLKLFGCGVQGVSKIVEQLHGVGKLSMFSGEFWQAVGQLGGGVLASFFIGGAILALFCTPLTYWAVYRYVVFHRAHKVVDNRQSHTCR